MNKKENYLIKLKLIIKLILEESSLEISPLIPII